MFAKNGVSGGSVGRGINSYHLKLHRMPYNGFCFRFGVRISEGLSTLYLPLQAEAG